MKSYPFHELHNISKAKLIWKPSWLVEVAVQDLGQNKHPPYNFQHLNGLLH
jgi:hypothetical protein